jgi:peptidoglycan/LPS O-acetylase OafA/YrhL
LPRIREIDVLRGFAILAVIAIHVTMNVYAIPQVNGLVIALLEADIFSHFAVPLFIFISGFVLSHNYPAGFSIGQYYKKRLPAIIPQYLAFSIFYIAGRIVLYGPLAAGTILFYILTASGSYHLWFIAVIIELYMLYPLISGIYRRFDAAGHLPALFIFALALQITWDSVYSLLGTFAGTSPAYLLAQRVFLSQVLYFILGIYAAGNYGRIKTLVKNIRPAYPVLCAILATGVFSLAWIYPYNDLPKYGLLSTMTLALNIAPRLLEPIIYLPAFILCLKSAYYLMEKKGAMFTALSSLGKYSFGIYLIHVFFMVIFIKGLATAGLGPTQWLFYPVLYTLTLISSYAGVYLISYLPGSALLVGTHNVIKKKIPAPVRV